jgi:hypothetical protein
MTPSLRMATLGGALLLFATAAAAPVGRAPGVGADAPELVRAGPYRLAVAADGDVSLSWRGLPLAEHQSAQAQLAAAAAPTLRLDRYPEHRIVRAGGRVTVTGVGGGWPELGLTCDLTAAGLTLTMSVRVRGTPVARFVPLTLTVPQRLVGATPTVLLQGYGDYDGSRVSRVLPEAGAAQSDWLTEVSDGPRGAAVLVGALSARRALAGAQLARTATGVRVALVSGLSGPGGAEPVPPTGGSVRSETLAVMAGPDAFTLARAYARTVRPDPPGPPLVGLSTWGADGPDPSLGAALRDAASVRRLFPWARRPYLEVDDGWERQYGDWRANGRFPGGLSALAADLARRGVTPGLWLAPFLISPSAPLARRHPGWLVRRADGAPETGPYGDDLLDVTAPGAGGYLTALVRRLARLGFGVLKVDFMYAGALPGRRHDRAVTGPQAYRIGLADIARGLAQSGRSVRLIGSGAPLLPAAGFAAWRTGPDIEDYAAGRTVDLRTLLPEARSAAADLFLNGAATRCDPDDLLLAPPAGRRGAEADLRALFAAMAGGILTDGDAPSRLTPALAALVRPAFWGTLLRDAPLAPLALGEAAGAPPDVWRRAGGGRVWLSVLNFSTRPLTVRLPARLWGGGALARRVGSAAPARLVPRQGAVVLRLPAYGAVLLESGRS